MKTRTVEIELPAAVVQELAALVEEGRFASEAEAVRLALAEYLRRRPFELQEQFHREDIAWGLGRTGGEETRTDPPGERDRFVKAVEEGLADAEAGRVIADGELGRDLDHRLLLALARLGIGLEHQEKVDFLLRRYLDEEISLSKLAERFGVSRFELQESFGRLGVPVRLGPATLEEARDEAKVGRNLE